MGRVIFFLALLLAISYPIRAAVVCGEYQYNGNFTTQLYNSKHYVYVPLEWIVQPPLELRLFHDGVLVNQASQEGTLLDLSEFTQSYPWVTEELFAHSTLVTFSLASVMLGPPETTDLRSCKIHHDALNFYWDEIPLANMFSAYPVQCNEKGSLDFAVDPAAHMIKDAWGDKPRRPYDGKHYFPRNGRASFATAIANANERKMTTVPLTIDYYSGVRPNLREIRVRTCTNVDIPGFSAALVRRYNETRNEHALSKRGAPVELITEQEPKLETEADVDRWVMDQLRAQGVPVDLPRVGKLAPPEPVRHKPPPGPYDPELFDADAFVAPGDNIAQEQGIVSVQGAPDAQQVIADGRLWPTLDCVHHRTDGTCIAAFGYIFSGTEGRDIEVADEQNWFEPLQFLTDFELPTHFEPGSHRNAFVIRWFCRGDTIGSWNNIYWTLHGSTVSATLSTPRCGIDLEEKKEMDNALEEISKIHKDERRGNLFRSLLSIDEEEEQQQRGKRQEEEEETTAPPTEEPCDVDGGSCDGTIQPRLECSHNFENGTCVSYFGYLNKANTTLSVAVGFPDNYFLFQPGGGGDEDQGQPSEFLSGRQYNVFSVYWSCQPSSGSPSSITWVLNTTATAGSAVHNTCPVGCDDVPYSERTDCPTNPPSSSSSANFASGSSSAAESSSSSSSSSSSFSSSSSTGGIPTPCPTQDPCSFSSNLVLYRDRDFTEPYRPRRREPPTIEALDTAYGLLSMDIPTDWLPDFCLEITRVVQCLCNDTFPCIPFKPSQPGSTGCNSPGVEKRIIYRASPLVEIDDFQFEEDPPTYCSGQRAFSWDQQLIAPPGYKLLVQADWTYSTLNGEHDCSGTSQGGSGASFTCGCPDSHKWNASCQCCQAANVTVNVNVNVTVINIINVTVPDSGAAAVSAIAAATASIATATLAATTGTTGVNIIINNNHDLPWWSWLILGVLGIPTALASLCCILGCLGCIGMFSAPKQECEQVLVAEEAPCDPCQENRPVGRNGMPYAFDNLYAIPMKTLDASSKISRENGQWVYNKGQ